MLRCCMKKNPYFPSGRLRRLSGNSRNLGIDDLHGQHDFAAPTVTGWLNGSRSPANLRPSCMIGTWSETNPWSEAPPGTASSLTRSVMGQVLTMTIMMIFRGSSHSHGPSVTTSFWTSDNSRPEGELHQRQKNVVEIFMLSFMRCPFDRS